MDEKSLIKQAIRGDKNAFASLYALYKDDLYRYAYFRLGNADDANDAVSSCVTAAYEGIYKLRAAGAFKGWIFKILYYSCGKLIADRQQRVTVRMSRSLTAYRHRRIICRLNCRRRLRRLVRRTERSSCSAW